MSLEKAILHKKEHRKPYYDSRAVDFMCRNHGGCSYCNKNRQFQGRRDKEALSAELEEFQYL